MAEKTIAYKVKVETGKAASSLGELEQAFKEVKTEVKSLGKDATLENRFKELNNTIKTTPVNIRAMNKQIQEYQAIALEAGRTSPIGKAAIAEAANLKDRYNDINAEVNRLANDGVRMQAALDIGTSVVAGYTAFQGAMALTGIESEELQETLVKLQGAQSILMGVETLRKNLEKESTIVLQAKLLQEKLNTAATYAGSVAQSVYAFAVGTSTGAMKLFRIAMLATGIGAIIVGIGLLIANFDKVTAAVQSAVKWFMSLGEGVKLAISIIFPFIGLIRLVNAALVSMGVVQDQTTKKTISAAEKRAAAIKKEAEETIKQNKLQLKSIQKYTKDVVESIDWEIRQREAAGKDIGALEKTKLLILKKSSEDQIKLLESTINESKRIRGDSSILFRKSDEIVAEAQLEFQKKNLKKLSQDIEISNTEYLTAASDKALADAKIIEKANADKRKQEKDASDKRSEARKKENEKRVSEQEALNEKLAELELERIANEQRELQEQLTREEEQFQMLRDLRQSEQENEMDDLIEGYESKFELANGNAELELALQDQLNKDLGILNDKYRAKETVADDEKIKLERLNNKQRVEMGSEALGALSTLVSAFSTDNEQQAKRQFKVNKALNLAQATTNTALAITGALAEPSLAPGARFAKAAIAGTIGAANIIKIASTQFGSTGGGSGGSVSLGNTAGATGGANVPSVTNTTTTLDGATQVYVTEQDISNTQNKVQVAENIATV